MQNPVTRTKQIVHQHRGKIACVAGIAIGISIGKRFPLKPITIGIQPGEFQQIVEDPEMMLAFAAPYDFITVVAAPQT